jgi:hypothetical protein
VDAVMICAVEKVPAGHRKHWLILYLAVWLPQRPGPQGWHSVAISKEEYVPAAHWIHVLSEEDPLTVP